MQSDSSSSPLFDPSSLAALLVGSEAGTTDAGSGYDGGGGCPSDTGKPTYRASIEGGGGGGLTTTAGPLMNPSNSSRTGRGRERSGEVEVEERYKRFREKGDFTADTGSGIGGDDDDPVGRPWGRFDSTMEVEREREREERDEGGGGGVMPLRLPIKNPDPNRVVRGAGAG